MSDNQEKEFSIQASPTLIPPHPGSPLTYPQPIDESKDKGGSVIDAIKSKVAPHTAAPGPAVSHDHSEIPQEGTKEERLAKAKELNK
jgi:hypothetical protein